MSALLSVNPTSLTITIGETAVTQTPDSGNGNLLVAQPVTLNQTATLQSLSFYVTAAAGSLRLGVYDASGSGGTPGSKKAETASLVATTGWNTANVITPVSLSPGNYYLAYLPSDNNLSFVKAVTGGTSLYYSYNYGALPATFSTSASTTGSHWSFYGTLTVQSSAPSISAISVAPTSVIGGTSSQGTVTLTAAAPAGGVVVSSSSANPSVATVPASVTVPVGSVSATFAISTSSVPASTSVSVSGSCSGVSKSASLTVNPTSPPPDTTPPVISGVAASSITSSGATVTWTTNEASDTQVDYGTTTAYGSSTALVSSMVTNHSAALSALSASALYHYRVKSRDAAGNLAQSGDFTLTTSSAPDTTPPVINLVTASSITSGGAIITWTTNEASNSQVDYGITTAYGSSSLLDSSLVTGHSATLSGLSATTLYHYRVKSRDAAGNLAVSGDFTLTTSLLDTTPPVISGVAASSITSSGANINWATNEASSSRVDYGTTTLYGSSTPLDLTLVTSHGATLSGLSATTLYHYRVKSVDAAGNLAVSADFTFTTLSTTPTPTTIYVATNGLPGNSGSSGSPIDLATAVSPSGPVRPGYTVQLSAGIYRYSSVTFAPAGTSPNVMTVFTAAPGERVIITTPSNTPPNIYMGDYMRLDGLWFGGTKLTSDTADIFLGGSPIGRWKQIVNCTIFGYYGGIESGSAEYSLIQGNRFVHTGGGNLWHSIYISGNENWPPVPGTLTQHTIVDSNMMLGSSDQVNDGGYGVHFFHNNRTGIATRNFVTYQWGLVMDGEEELAANNLFWKCGMNDGSRLALTWIYAKNSRVHNNILGPLDYFMNNGDPTNTISKNAFEGSPTGTNPITLTPGLEALQIGLSAASIDGAIATLNAAFSRSVDTIFADSTIEPAFATIRGITVPTASPLYHTGQPWFDANPINIGHNSGAPATIAAFWQAFRALGLKEYDSNGNIIP